MRALLFCFVLPFMGCNSTPGGLLSQSMFGATDDTIPPEAYNHYIAATIHRRGGRFDLAIEELRKAADLAPDSRSLQERMIRFYVSAERFDEALDICQRAVEHHPDDVTLKLWLGGIYLQMDRYQEAIDSYNEAIELDPDNPRIYTDLINVEESINDLTAAVENYEILLERFPDNARLWFQYALNLVRINDNEAAIEALHKVIDLAEESGQDLPRAKYILGIVYMDEDELETAIALLREYLEEEPDNVRARINLSGALARSNNETAAIDTMEEVVDADDQALHVLLRMFLMLHAERYEAGAEIIPPNDAPYLGSVYRALFRKHLGEAYRPILDSLDMFDGDLAFECDTFITETVTLYGDDRAGPYLAQELHKIRQEGVQSKVVDTFLGRTYMVMQDWDAAAPVLESVIDEYGYDKSIHYYLATIHEELDNFSDTERHLRAILEREPDDADTLNFLGYAYAEEDTNLDEAQEMLEKALEIDPDNGFYLDSLGWIYYRKGNGERAVELIRQAIRNMGTDDAVLRDHLGDAYLLAGDVEKALVEWRKARRLDPKLEGVQEKIDEHLNTRRTRGVLWWRDDNDTTPVNE